MKPGATLGLSHGFLLGVMQNDGASFRDDINVILMAPKVSHALQVICSCNILHIATRLNMRQRSSETVGGRVETWEGKQACACAGAAPGQRGAGVCWPDIQHVTSAWPAFSLMPIALHAEWYKAENLQACNSHHQMLLNIIPNFADCFKARMLLSQDRPE